MGSPVGISGAGVWRFEKPPQNELWTPRRQARLIGINSAWNKQTTEYVELLAEQESWLYATVATF
jgi:hypothetical protein